MGPSAPLGNSVAPTAVCPGRHGVYVSRPSVLIIGINYLPERTGIAPYTAGMARGLSNDFDVKVLTTHPHYPDWSFDEENPAWRSDEPDGDVKVSRLRHYVPSNATGATRILSEATFAARAAVAQGKRADAIVCVTPGLLPVATGHLLGKVWGVHVGVVVQDLYSRAFAELDLFGGRLNGAVHRLEERLLRSADGVVAIHPKMAETIATQYGVERSRLTSIPNWSHVGTPTHESRAVRHDLGWSDDELVILHAGNMGAKQGLEHVVESARLADDGDRRIRFVLMGGGSRRGALEAASADVEALTIMDGVSDRQFANVLAAADVLLLHERPGLQEMCAPSKLTSYFAAGRPILAVTEENSAAAMEMGASQAGIVVRPGSEADYISAAIALTEVDQEALCSRARAYAKDTLSEPNALARYRAWVTTLLGDG